MVCQASAVLTLHSVPGSLGRLSQHKELVFTPAQGTCFALVFFSTVNPSP